MRSGSEVASTLLSEAGTMEHQDGLGEKDDTTKSSIPRMINAPNLNEASTCEEDPETFTELEEHKKTLKKLRGAVEKALTIPEPATTTAEDGKGEPKFVNISFHDSPFFVIPWKACYTWQRMTALLTEWYREDQDALKDIARGAFEVKRYRDDTFDVMHPHFWEMLLEHDTNIGFSRCTSQKDVVEANYENRIQYTVSYFEETNHNFLNFVRKSTHQEPVEFEILYENENYPALEELKDVISPLGMASQVSTNQDKKAKLRQSDKQGSTSVRIHSPFLLNVLKSVIEYSATPLAGEKDGLNAGLFAHPYMDLYLHWEDVVRYRTGENELRSKHSATFNQHADEHIELLQKFLFSQPGIPYKHWQTKWAKTIPTTSYNGIWALMKPGEDVYVRDDDGSLAAYVVDKVVPQMKRDDPNQSVVRCKVIVWNLILSSKNLVQIDRTINIDAFDDEREITGLPVFPVRFIDDKDNGAFRRKLIARGGKYFQYSKQPTFLQYTGKSPRKGAKSYKRARVIVEHKTAPWLSIPPDDFHLPGIPIWENDVGRSIRIPGCECDTCKMSAMSRESPPRLKFSDYENIDPSRVEKLSEHQCLILASHMFGFVLRDRAYDLLAIDGLEVPSIVETAIDTLVMKPSNKDIIKAIAKIYTEVDQENRFSADFIHGKGEGQIILLHGPPGTGKTLTAAKEAVAEYTKRPLLSITAADLGHEADALERNLLRFFKMGNEWDAIILLDEADVYLEQRSMNDIRRNSIVSVFLRALDYFQGILFLTTNRVGHFDEAFMSRIHLSLGYEKLDDSAREQIWNNLFRKLREDKERGGIEIDYEYDAKQYVKTKEVRSLQWNGREIRNAFQTATALAVFDSRNKNKPSVPQLTEHHIKQVVTMSSAFRKYMQAAHQGMDDSTWAFKHGNREDNFRNSLSASHD